jgi:hypothetical protein
MRVPFWLRVALTWIGCLLAFPVATRLLGAWAEWVWAL